MTPGWNCNMGDPSCTFSKPCPECLEFAEYARDLIALHDKPGMGFFNVKKEK